MTTPSAPVRLVGEGLVLREWEERDLPVMVELFDDPEVALWTPLPTPFTLAEAQARLERSRNRDPLQLAITVDGAEPLGEVAVDKGRTHRLQTWQHRRA